VVLLLVVWATISGVALPDSLTTESGKQLQGKIWRYDEYSYICIMEDGGQVILPEQVVKNVERDVPRLPRYKGRKSLIAVIDLLEEDESGQRVLVARLTDLAAEVEPYGLKTEAQALQYFLDSEERYAEAYRVSYKQAWKTVELEYHWKKDLLLRRVRRPGGQVLMRVLGAAGTGRQTLEEAARGRFEINKKGFISTLGKSLSSMPQKRKVDRKGSKKAPRRTTPW
jgi:hypothetical protein